jgi:hypothetical protein
MADIVLLQNKLRGLSEKIKTKDALGKDYKKIVSDSLARIKAKITKILADHNKQVQEITRGSAENLEKTRAELAAQQARLKQASDTAIEAAKRNQEKLQNNLTDTNKQLNDLQEELKKPNIDTQNTQVIVEKLRQDLQNATAASAAANAQIAQLEERIRGYDGIKERMDELVKNLLTKIGDILAQVDAMSINQGDITELLQLLNETENMFPNDDGTSPGSGGEGSIFGNLFGGPSGAGAGAGSGSGSGSGLSVKNSIDKGLRIAGYQPRGAGSEAGNLEDIYGESDQSIDATNPLVEPRRVGVGTGGINLGIKPIGTNPLAKLPGSMLSRVTNNKGGSRRRSKKTMHRGGYIEKLRAKKSRKRSQTSKRRSGRRSASSSSSSTSSNSRQKAMQGRKM